MIFLSLSLSAPAQLADNSKKHDMPVGTPGMVLHPVQKKCGFCTDYFDPADKDVGLWEILHHTEGLQRAAISLDKVVHLPKLPHQSGLKSYKLELVLKPGADYKVKAVQVKGGPVKLFNKAYGQVVSLLKPNGHLVIDSKALAGKANADAITVTLGKKGSKMPVSFLIPLNRIDSYPEAIELSGRKIMDEGHHEGHDYGSEWVKDEEKAGRLTGSIPELGLYYRPQGTHKVAISCYGHVMHALRHGIIAWHGNPWKVKNGSHPATGSIAAKTLLARAKTLKPLGWKIKYLKEGSTAGEQNLLTDLGISAADRVLNARNANFQFTKGSILARGPGEHCAVIVNGKAQEAHWRATGDKIYDRGDALNFLFAGEDYGFVLLPPQK